MNGKALAALVSALALFGTAGCSLESDPPPENAQPANQPPTLALEPLPEWPPVGPTTATSKPFGNPSPLELPTAYDGTGSESARLAVLKAIAYLVSPEFWKRWVALCTRLGFSVGVACAVSAPAAEME
jgi:hypothetical protein